MIPGRRGRRQIMICKKRTVSYSFMDYHDDIIKASAKSRRLTYMMAKGEEQ